jgi:hypothetical protein
MVKEEHEREGYYLQRLGFKSLGGSQHNSVILNVPAVYIYNLMAMLCNASNGV